MDVRIIGSDEEILITSPGWYLIGVPASGSPLAVNRVKRWDDRPIVGDVQTIDYEQMDMLLESDD